MKWSDEIRKLKIRTNAETPLDSKTAREFGAEGIGLCRTAVSYTHLTLPTKA